MEFFNRSKWHAGTCSTVIGPDDELMMAVVVRPCYRFLDGALEPITVDEDHPFPVVSEPLKTPYGTLDATQVFCRQDVDLIVCGEVYAPEGKPCESLALNVQVGDFKRHFKVWGDRCWEQEDDCLVLSTPEPFTSIPLDASRAYGGKVVTETGEVPFSYNPEGRGFIADVNAESDDAILLPNLEDPEHPILAPEDRPEPCFLGPCGQQSFLRVYNGVEMGTDPGKDALKITRFKPSLFNNAHPKLIVPSDQAAPGKLVSIDALSQDGAISFNVPDPALHLHVQLHHRHHLFPFHMEEIVIFPDSGLVSFGYRCVFRYKLEAMEKRAAVLYDGLAPERTPQSYAIKWDERTGEWLL